MNAWCLFDDSPGEAMAPYAFWAFLHFRRVRSYSREDEVSCDRRSYCGHESGARNVTL
jgi:hypothetical protein